MPAWDLINTAHFRYVHVQCATATHEFDFSGKKFRIAFEGTAFTSGQGLTVYQERPLEYEPRSTKVLTWLTLYLGEDIIGPRQHRDPAHIGTRGVLTFDSEQFRKYLKACEQHPRASHPRWKQRLFDRAVNYCVQAIRLGVYSMPIPLGLFGLSLECLGNYDYGRRDQYFTLGQKRFLNILRRALLKAKRDEVTGKRTRSFEKFVMQDIDLLHQLRNAFYGHSLLHLNKDRREITKAMREWYEREGFKPKFARKSFPVAKIEKAMVNEFWPLFKLGLRTTRLLLFIAMGRKSVPFATHDFAILDDLRPRGAGSANKAQAECEPSTALDP